MVEMPKLRPNLLIATASLIIRDPGYEQTMTGDLYITRHSVGFEDLPANVTYTKVRIKSSVPYPVKQILWRNYYWGWVHK